ncbi:MAG: winged helix-turn-helix domain-containing protein [Thermoleophilia bacterium]|nr:winged helix-turn-helix domain-containing protein [Thermoleophilia bacterium]
MQIRSKVWIEVNGKPVFSKGRGMLFHAIEKHGSINMAAKEMGITYRRAWGYIKAMEERMGVKLVETRQGGAHGGGAELTSEAKELLAKFESLERGLNQLVDKRFGKLFEEGPKK